MTATCGRVPQNPMQGSWFPTGFHGHFRSKSRNDFICEYRQLARPQPPEKFFRRSTLPPAKNVFSRHDNRHSFLSDAMYFEQGLGRRRIKRSTFAYNPELLTWMPSQQELLRSGPPRTSYQNNYPGSREQILVTPIANSFDAAPTSTYRYTHGQANPHMDTIRSMNSDALGTSFLNRPGKAKPTNAYGRESVASCLTWHTPQPPITPCLPPQTALRSQAPQQQPAVQPSRSRTNVPAATAICPPSSPPKTDTNTDVPPLVLPESS